MTDGKEKQAQLHFSGSKGPSIVCSKKKNPSHSKDPNN